MAGTVPKNVTGERRGRETFPNMNLKPAARVKARKNVDDDDDDATKTFQSEGNPSVSQSLLPCPPATSACPSASFDPGMRDLILRQSHAACQHGVRPRVTLQHSRTQHLRYKSDRAPAVPVQKFNVASTCRGHDTAIDTPRISTDPKYAITGLVPDLSTTRPAPLDLPEPPHEFAWPSSRSKDPSKWDFKYLFHLGKAYGKFYWAGIKNVWANYKVRQQIVKRLNGTPVDMAARLAGAPQRISYNEYELLLRSKRDLKKLIPFGLVFAICGEFTPLIIVALGSRVVPGTCVIPKQITQDHKKILDRESLYMKHMADTWRTRLDTVERPGDRDQDMRPFLLPDAYRLGLIPFMSPTSLPALASDLYWRLRLWNRFQKHSNEILSTAVLIQREGGWAKRSPQDMWEWGNKYGMYTLRQFATQAIKRGEDPVSEKMKTSLLPIFNEETNAIVHDAKQRARTQPFSFWTMEHHDPLLWNRPDCKAMRRDIERSLGHKQRYPEVEVKKG